ncbi:rCG43288 [Rattus norvegicus]|uniref:RCG43288 n=1 Tax=Rattus norvegicus TaxID=10116 RepID=A6IWM4_RAT|nr:rCG43288 [Rattus norvegicus]
MLLHPQFPLTLPEHKLVLLPRLSLASVSNVPSGLQKIRKEAPQIPVPSRDSWACLSPSWHSACRSTVTGLLGAHSSFT